MGQGWRRGEKTLWVERAAEEQISGTGARQGVVVPSLWGVWQCSGQGCSDGPELGQQALGQPGVQPHRSMGQDVPNRPLQCVGDPFVLA